MGTLPPSWPMVRPVLPRASFPGALTACDCHPACDKFHRRFSCISSVLFLQRRLFLPTLAAETQQESVQPGKKSSCDVKPGVFSASMAALLRPRHAVWGLPLSGKATGSLRSTAQLRVASLFCGFKVASLVENVPMVPCHPFSPSFW